MGSKYTINVRYTEGSVEAVPLAKANQLIKRKQAVMCDEQPEESMRRWRKRYGS